MIIRMWIDKNFVTITEETKNNKCIRKIPIDNISFIECIDDKDIAFQLKYNPTWFNIKYNDTEIRDSDFIDLVIALNKYYERKKSDTKGQTIKWYEHPNLQCAMSPTSLKLGADPD